MIKILLAEYGRACLYEMARYGDPLLPLAVLIDPAVHLREHELGTDAPGRTFNRASGARQVYERSNRLRGAVSLFVWQIGKYLETSLRRGEPVPQTAAVPWHS